MSNHEPAAGQDTPASSGREPETVPPARLSRGLGAPGRWIAGRRPLVMAATCLVVLLAVLAGLLDWRGHGSAGGKAGSAAESSAPSQSETAAVMQLLQQHADALLHRDGTGWAAGLDGSKAAAGYREHQQAVYDNLAPVPLSNWRYVLAAPVTDSTVLGPAATRLGGRVLVLHVQLQYALAAVDPAPTAKELWLTAVHRKDGWRLAGDSDAAEAGGPSWQGPWDFGRLVVRAGPHTLVLAHPAHAGDEASFQALVEHSVPVVSSVWGTGWNQHVAVLIPDTAAEFAQVTGDSADSHDLAAVAVADSIGGDGTVLGARIVLNPDNLSRLDAAGRRLVVQHELTHIADRAQTSDQMPTWLIEGFADYVGNLGSGQPIKVAARELASEIRQAKVPTALPADAAFAGSNPRLAQLYEQSWLACRLIASKAGQQGLVRFYRTVAAASRLDPATATSLGLRQVLHTTVAGFTASWRAALVAELR